jgi:hypothetical protein
MRGTLGVVLEVKLKGIRVYTCGGVYNQFIKIMAVPNVIPLRSALFPSRLTLDAVSRPRNYSQTLRFYLATALGALAETP